MKSFSLVLCVIMIVSCNKEDLETDPILTTPQSTFYINAATGNDSNSGNSKADAWKSISKIKGRIFEPGDQIFFAAGVTFNEPIILQNAIGTSDNPIIITSYAAVGSTGDKALIDVKGELNALNLVNCSFINVSKLSLSAGPAQSHTPNNNISAMRCGVLVEYSKSGIHQNIVLDNLLVKDVFYEKKGYSRSEEEVNTSNGTQNYGWGIRIISSSEYAIIKDVTVKNCEVENVSHTGIKFTGKKKNIRNVIVENCKVLETGGPGIQLGNVDKGHFSNNYVNKSGSSSDSRKWSRGSGLWTWGCKDVLIEKNYFLNANGPADSAGVHIDFNCSNVIIQYNFSANNAGGFCEILGNNYNCAYRYNVSFNDGHRVKGENGATQDGKTLWLSGYVGNGNPQKGPFNSYIYNNTIYTSENMVSKMSFTKTLSGALIMNNIFYIKGLSEFISSGSTQDFVGKNIVFENNLFLRSGNWPVDFPIQDIAPLSGDPEFKLNGGNVISDYIPQNNDLIKNKGKEIVKIPNDNIGLTLGLQVTHDILGNLVVGLPDLGAIEIN